MTQTVQKKLNTDLTSQVVGYSLEKEHNIRIKLQIAGMEAAGMGCRPIILTALGDNFLYNHCR